MTRVETRVVTIRGNRRVLLQLPTGYVVLTPLAARQLAELLVDMAGHAENGTLNGQR